MSVSLEVLERGEAVFSFAWRASLFIAMTAGLYGLLLSKFI